MVNPPAVVTLEEWRTLQNTVAESYRQFFLILSVLDNKPLTRKQFPGLPMDATDGINVELDEKNLPFRVVVINSREENAGFYLVRR